MSTVLIRVAVPCTELTKVVILNRYQSELINEKTLNISQLNLDIISFDRKSKIRENKHRTETISILLNRHHSERYKPNYTEAAIANSIEKKVREILLERMLGAYSVKNELDDAMNSIMNSLGLLESNVEYECIRKFFYRARVNLTKENLPPHLLRK